ncbi:metal-dependent transcriptional regulator [Weeksellaceae bacterium TAE3-ERU29]|nr:metal-dependent transcriptional regulator [Weeksellaceae bacterium TAE3-ERU29]
MNSRAEENYLKSLLHLSKKNADISTNDISKRLNIKMPTVTGMMKKFAEKGWVDYQSYKPIRLTEEGKRQAAIVVRKHRLTEMFLVDVMNFSWSEVHEIAEQIEHIKSPSFFDKMDEMLNFPTVDPHGAPIPDKNGYIKESTAYKLSLCKEGDVVFISSVYDSSEEFLQFLNEINLKLGDKIEVKKKHSFDNSVVVHFNGEDYTFSKAVTEMIFVDKNV